MIHIEKIPFLCDDLMGGEGERRGGLAWYFI